MNILHLDELRRLPGMIRGLDRSEFSMAFWRAERSCGTTGCAIGWGIVKGIISGLRLYQTNHNKFLFYPESADGERAKDNVQVLVADYFGIRLTDSMNLFSPGSYAIDSREAVAARIEKFIEEHAPAERLVEMKPSPQREVICK